MNAIELFVNDDAVTMSDQTMYGDKMVPVRSASLGFMAGDKTVYQAAQHNELLKTPETIHYISAVIEGRE